jgi:hypothetical protein
MMLGRTIRLAGGEDVSIVKPKWCTRLFLTADLSTLIIQGLGASIMGTMQVDMAIAGEKVVIAGLSLQVATFIAFILVAANFHVRMNRKASQLPTRPSRSTPRTPRDENEDWRKMLKILYAISSLILFRCIFRLIEYSMGNASYLMAHEWCLYVFDMVPMVIVLVLMLVLQPTRFIAPLERKLSDETDTVELGVAPSV